MLGRFFLCVLLCWLARTFRWDSIPSSVSYSAQLDLACRQMFSRPLLLQARLCISERFLVMAAILRGYGGAQTGGGWPVLRGFYVNRGSEHIRGKLGVLR